MVKRTYFFETEEVIFAESFVLKVVQLDELLYVRHSVFIVGNAGTGKSQVWKTLFRTYQNLKKKPVVCDLNPKARVDSPLNLPHFPASYIFVLSAYVFPPNRQDFESGRKICCGKPKFCQIRAKFSLARPKITPKNSLNGS